MSVRIYSPESKRSHTTYALLEKENSVCLSSVQLNLSLAVTSNNNQVGRVDVKKQNIYKKLPLKVLVETIDAQWEGMGDVGSARYESALLPPCPTIRGLSYSD